MQLKIEYLEEIKQLEEQGFLVSYGDAGLQVD